MKILFVCHGRISPNLEKSLYLQGNSLSEIKFTNGLPTKPESQTCSNYKEHLSAADSAIGQVFTYFLSTKHSR